MMSELIERLRAHEGDCLRAADMDSDAVLGAEQIADIAAALREAAAALEAAREDAERLDALEALVKEQPDRALLLHHGVHIVRSGERFYAGIGLSNTRRSLRQAIDQARGKENGNG